MLEQQFQVAFEAVSLVVRIREYLYVGRLIQGVFDASQDRGAERVGNIEEHDADAVASLAAQKSRHRIRPVAEFLRYVLNALFRRRRNVTRQWRVVQHNRYRETFAASPFHQTWRLRGHHHPSRVAQYAMALVARRASFRGHLK